MERRKIRGLARSVAVTLVLLMFASSAAALCVTQTIEGMWYNVDRNGLVRTVKIVVPCCDTAPSSCSSTPQLHFNLPCSAAGNCTLSSVALETFWNGTQLSRLDTKIVGTDIAWHFVILSLDERQLLVHTSIDFANNSAGQDSTALEYFERARCITLYGREYCFARPFPLARPAP